MNLTFDDGWYVHENVLGFTIFSNPAPAGLGSSYLAVMRPTVFTNPVDPTASIGAQEFWPATGMSLERFEEWLDLLPDGMVVGEPERADIGGRPSVTFDVEMADDFECGHDGFCVGLLINTVAADGVTGWTFEPGNRERIWVVAGGEHEPLVIVVGTTPDAPDMRPAADEVLATVVIGEPEPHPVDPADWGTDF